MTKAQILVVDDEPSLRKVLSAQLTRDGHDVLVAADGEQAVTALRDHHIDVVISDLRMPKMDGLALLKHVANEHPDVPVIMITAHGTIDTAVTALKNGAFDYVTKPFDREELRAIVRKAAQTRALAGGGNAESSNGERGRFKIVGTSEPMRSVYAIIEKVADTPSTVLITGESGTGKELVARALHENSSRRDAPYIRVNCAAIPKPLIESELFGHEKGAFTGAVASKPGRFELADGGTLFLDEIGEVPVNMQVKLLRAIQESEFERVGGVKTISVDVRLVTATNRDLKADITDGRFRDDLYYRLNVVRVPLPPLRERTDDVPLLLTHFIERFNERLDRAISGFDEAALQVLLRYPWPGNIRELENVVERCMLFAEGDMVEVSDLPPELRAGDAPAARRDSVVPIDPETGLKGAVKEATVKLERELIARALRKTGGNVTHTARLLKISRKGLQTKMKELGLRDDEPTDKA